MNGIVADGDRRALTALDERLRELRRQLVSEPDPDIRRHLQDEIAATETQRNEIATNPRILF
jgi:hypothetical protein